MLGRIKELEGVLLVDKPRDHTSHDVIARLRALFGRRAALGNLAWLAPPVPTMNSRMPFTGSAFPSGSCCANRS